MMQFLMTKILCPTLPERYNGYFDTDGCPDNVYVESLADADFDGVIDYLDNCKYEREVYNPISR